MGTRADFYIGRGEKAEWLGSIAWDGYPDGDPESGLSCKTEEEFRAWVKNVMGARGDFTAPEVGWPWPWEDSRTTDYAYALDGGKVWASCFGHEWFDPLQPQPEEDTPKNAAFPNMKDRKNVTFGPRSGVMIFTAPADPKDASEKRT